MILKYMGLHPKDATGQKDLTNPSATLAWCTDENVNSVFT